MPISFSSAACCSGGSASKAWRYSSGSPATTAWGSTPPAAASAPAAAEVPIAVAVPAAAASLSFLNGPHSQKHRYDEQKEHKSRAYVQLIHHINSDPMPYTSPAISHAMTH